SLLHLLLSSFFIVESEVLVIDSRVLVINDSIVIVHVGTGLVNIGYGSKNLGFGKVINTESQRVNAAEIVVLIVAGVASCSWVIELTRRESRGFVSEQRIATDGGNLASKLGSNLLVELLSTLASRI